jgi:hypothetical protein
VDDGYTRHVRAYPVVNPRGTRDQAGSLCRARDPRTPSVTRDTRAVGVPSRQIRPNIADASYRAADFRSKSAERQLAKSAFANDKLPCTPVSLVFFIRLFEILSDFILLCTFALLDSSLIGKTADEFL